jgi:RHS repeat-associated protein
MTDRLGSVRLNGNGARSSYQPYGAEVAPATNDQRTKFATYYRDSAGLDYAGQRYYGNAMGRFLTPDPGGQRTANPKDPGSWNRYAYAGGDPVNRRDPSGRFSALLYAPPNDDIGDGWDFGDDEDGGGEGDPCFADEFGFGPDPACYVGAPVAAQPDPDSGPASNCPPKYRSWINAHGADASAVASPLGTTEADVLGLSALESGWGSGPFVGQGRNAYFDLETLKTQKNPNPKLLPFSTGWATASENPNKLVATYDSYLNSAKSFAAVEGRLIKGVTDPARFATILQQQGRFGIGSNGPLPSFVPNLVSIISILSDCLGQ